jgi:hypothetical protein
VLKWTCSANAREAVDGDVGHGRSPSDIVPVGGKPTGLSRQDLDEVVWRPGHPPLARTEDLGRTTLQGRGLDLVRALRPAERCFQQAQRRLALRNIFAFEAVDDVSTMLRGRERPAQAIPDRKDVGVVTVSEALVPRMVDLVHVGAGEHKSDRRIQPLRQPDVGVLAHSVQRGPHAIDGEGQR